MNGDFDSMQSIQCIYHEKQSRGWIHSGLLAYALCFAVIAMSSVALLVNANRIEQDQRSVKHHP